MRVGTANFDNTNHIYSEAYGGNRYDPGRLPMDNDYLAFRQVLWLATDRAYKTAEDAIARKRSSLKNMSLTEALPDFSKAPGCPLDSADRAQAFCHRRPGRVEVVRLSALFDAYPKIFRSGVEMHSSQSTNYVCHFGRHGAADARRSGLYSRAGHGLAPDGTRGPGRAVFPSLRCRTVFLPKSVLTREIKAVAEHVTALSQAPVGEAYDGPVLFEARAAAQLFGQLLGDNLKMTRKPVAIPGRPPLLAERTGEQARVPHSAGLDGCGGRSHADRISRSHAARALRLRYGRRCAATAAAGGERRAENVFCSRVRRFQGLSRFQRTRAHVRILSARARPASAIFLFALPKPRRRRT